MYIEKVVIIDDNEKTIRNGDVVIYINKEDSQVTTGILSDLELVEIDAEEKYLSFRIRPKNSEKIFTVNNQHIENMNIYKYDDHNFQGNPQVIAILEELLNEQEELW